MKSPDGSYTINDRGLPGIFQKGGATMEALEFSVPYNNDPGLLSGIFKLKDISNNRISEIYLSGSREFSGSGRITPETSADEFLRVVQKIHNQGIRVNLVLNSTCEGIDWYSQKTMDSTMEYLKRMHEEYEVEAVTIANPLYLQEARRRFKDLEICVSVLAEVDCLQRAEIHRQAEPDVITPDVNINRDLELLKEIKKATGARLRLLVNEGCLYKCPFRKFHFNLTSHISKETNEGEGIDISCGNFFGACSGVIKKDKSQILKSCWIRPGDTRKYIEVTNYFKIVDRSFRSTAILRAVKAYLQESWDGNLLDIISGGSKRFDFFFNACLDNKELANHDFFNTVTSCGHDCRKCDYCQELADKLIRLQMLTRSKLEDLGYSEGMIKELEHTGKLTKII